MANLMPADRLSTVDEHVELIVESLEPLEPYDQARVQGSIPGTHRAIGCYHGYFS